MTKSEKNDVQAGSEAEELKPAAEEPIAEEPAAEEPDAKEPPAKEPASKKSAPVADAVEPAPEAVVPAVDETADPAALQAEIDRLKAENAALNATAAPHTFWRNASAGVLILIGVVLVALSISALWLNRTIMDENRFVDTFSPLAREVSIQDWVATTSTQAIFDNVDIEGYVKQALEPLPPQAMMLATPITNAVQNFISEAATKIVRSDQFATVWDKSLHITHKAFIAAISDKTSGVITKEGGVVTLDVSLLVDEIKAALADKGLGFVQNINLPISTSQITLVDSQALADFSAAIKLLNATAFVLPLLALVLLSGGIAIAANRRKAVLWMGVGIVVLTIIPVQAIYLGEIPFSKAMLDLASMPGAAAQAAYDIIFVNLIRANQLASIVGLVFFIGAILAGPSAWATALRNGLRHGLGNIGPDWDFGVVGEWINNHESGMRTTGIILGVVLLLVSPAKSVATIVWVVVFVLVWILAVMFFGRPRPVKKVDAIAASADDEATPAAG